MSFTPHRESDVTAMLATLGLDSLEELIAHIPAGLRARASLNLGPGLSEQEVAAQLSALAARNRAADQYASFLGGGCYRHYVPAAVRAIIGRAEFATSYTPYQPEASQGTTQAIFEFQTLITHLTGLEVANASMYDGASAAAEAVLMARRAKPERSVVALSRALWPDYRETIRTYLAAQGELELLDVPFEPAAGITSLRALQEIPAPSLLCTVTGYPNAFGVIEPLAAIAALTHRAGGLALSVTAEALALALLKSPGESGVDLAAGEGASFGLAPEFGGPGVGFMAARLAQVRQMPGRLVGETVDAAGRRAWCLTLATREQHIRRQRATSNICTNHSLCALAAAVYLALMGRRGLRNLAARNVELAHRAAERLAAAGIRRRFRGAFFNEFVASVPEPAAALARAERRKIIAGLDLTAGYPEITDGLLIAVTEANSDQQIEMLGAALGGGSDGRE